MYPFFQFERHHAGRKLWQSTRRHQQVCFWPDVSTFIPRSSSKFSFEEDLGIKVETSGQKQTCWCLWVLCHFFSVGKNFKVCHPKSLASLCRYGIGCSSMCICWKRPISLKVKASSRSLNPKRPGFLTALSVRKRLLSCCHWPLAVMLSLDDWAWRVASASELPFVYGIVLYCICIVGKSTDTVYSKKKKKKKRKRKKNPARYVISIQISGERTAAAYVITVFTL